jgi:hypothetical protein
LNVPKFSSFLCLSPNRKAFFAIFLMAIPALTLHAGAQTQGSLPTLGDTSDLTVSAERRLGDRN